ncbi:hypothetical protein SK128_004474 [Halocaridina rubra]|uniref:Uncharacterized protein n=1 Tax=Halocaridina rubra TaxID=373956 RepID=A0AAN8WWK6_HALRR
MRRIYEVCESVPKRGLMSLLVMNIQSPREWSKVPPLCRHFNQVSCKINCDTERTKTWKWNNRTFERIQRIFTSKKMHEMRQISEIYIPREVMK